MNDPYLSHLVFVKKILSPAGDFFDPFNRLDNIQYPFVIVSHSTRASLSTLARIRSRSPASVTTSTGR